MNMFFEGEKNLDEGIKFGPIYGRIKEFSRRFSRILGFR
jgi:hypothetical protein